MEPQEIHLSVEIDPKSPPVSQEAVTFETGASRQQVQDLSFFTYEHHGEGFSERDPGALTRFFEDLIMGRPLPAKFVSHKMGDIDTFLATALFLHRDLAIHPKTPEVVMAADMVHRLGDGMLGHIDPGLSHLFLILRATVVDVQVSQQEMSGKITTGLEWVREYILNGKSPYSKSDAVPTVLERGVDGFVLAESPGSLLGGWLDLYRMGFLRGLLVSPPKFDRRDMIAACKSHYVHMDLEKAALALNQEEVRSGEPSAWVAEGLWLYAPVGGTLIPVSRVAEVLLL